MLMNLSCKLYSNIVAFAQDKRGVTAIEYAIIGVAVSTIVYTVFNGSDSETGLKGALNTAMKTITSNVASAGTAVK